VLINFLLWNKSIIFNYNNLILTLKTHKMRMNYKETSTQKLLDITKTSNLKELQFIEKYSDARDKFDMYSQDYWKGVTHSLQNTLNAIFPSWANYDSIGHYVFYKNMSYKDAMTECISINKALKNE